jgi:hypothetical protein
MFPCNIGHQPEPRGLKSAGVRLREPVAVEQAAVGWRYAHAR